MNYREDSEFQEPQPLQIKTFVVARKIMTSVQDQIDKLNTILKTTLNTTLQKAISRQLSNDQHQPTILQRLQAKMLRIQKHTDQIQRLISTIDKVDQQQPYMTKIHQTQQHKAQPKPPANLAKKGSKKPISISSHHSKQQSSSSIQDIENDQNINQLSILFQSQMYQDAATYAKRLWPDYLQNQSFLYIYAKSLKELRMHGQACKVFEQYYDKKPKKMTKAENDKLITVMSEWVSCVKQLDQPKMEIPVLEKAIKVLKNYKRNEEQTKELAYYLHSLAIKYEGNTKKSKKNIKNTYCEALNYAQMDYILADYADFLYQSGQLQQSAQTTRILLKKYKKLQSSWLDIGIKTQFKLGNYMEVKQMLTKREAMCQKLSKQILKIQLEVEDYLGDSQKADEIRQLLK